MMTFEPQLVADVLVNLFGAGGVLIVAYNLRRAAPHDPVVYRVRWALRLVAALYLCRCLAWSTGSEFLHALADLIAITTPVAALAVAEGLMRIHAPVWLKLTTVCASFLAAILVVVPGISETFSGIVLLVAVAGGFVATGLFLTLRDRRSLTVAENRTIDRVVISMLLLVPLIATDFRSLWPDLPVRFGAVGTLILLLFAFGPGSTSSKGWERAFALLVFAVIAGLFSFGYIAAGQAGDFQQSIRVGAVGLSGLICAALFSELLGAQAERRQAADPLLAAQTSDEFLLRLQTHNIIGDARMLAAEEVAALHHPAFDSLLNAQPVLRFADAPWGRSENDDGVERARSLLTTYSATHVMRLSKNANRLVVFSLPPASADARAESEIQAAQRIGEFVFESEITP